MAIENRCAKGTPGVYNLQEGEKQRDIDASTNLESDFIRLALYAIKKDLNNVFDLDGWLSYTGDTKWLHGNSHPSLS